MNSLQLACCTLQFAYIFVIWTTHMSVLRTGKHTSAIWRPFSQLWPLMASPSMWKNVFLQHLLWKFLDIRFWRWEWPLWPIMPPRSKMPTPSGHQATATFLWHGKLLPLFFAQVCTGLKPLTNLLKGGAKMLEWTAPA
jgi:hypothetical protein